MLRLSERAGIFKKKTLSYYYLYKHEIVRIMCVYSAHDIYYRDEIGNISTSAVTFTSDAVQLQLVPRYVLFGGWKAAFCTGYNVPLQVCTLNCQFCCFFICNCGEFKIQIFF